MIRVLPSATPLSSAEAFGLSVLLDLSRLVRVDDPHAEVAQLRIVGGAGDEHHMAADNTVSFAREEGAVNIPRAVLRWITEIAGAAAEQRATERDRYARVPSRVNPLVAQGREREPVISRVAAELRAAIIAAAGRRPVRLVAPWPHGARWAAAFTHDLDVVAWWPLFTLLRVAELSKKRHAGQAARVLASAATSIGRDPVGRAVRDVLAGEREMGVRSTWFVLCGTPTARTMRAGDLTYLPESPAARRIVATVRAEGHEIGLHGSFATLESQRAFTEQRERLERIVDHPVLGVRQHYLRVNPGISQHAMLDSGFRYDATYGFPDRSGFRLGVADIVPAWDEREQQPLPLEEVPLAWMDRTLSKYRGVEDPRAWVADALETAAAARSTEGLWVGLWHPNLAPALGFPDAPAAYRELVHAIVSDQPYVATLGELVRWRVARRGVRITRLRSNGTVEAHVTTSMHASEPVVLENERGHAVQTIATADRQAAERSDADSRR